MKLEKEIILHYKKKFPFETLKETSERTGIQITRVYRLFNGRKMKVSELESFQRALEGDEFSKEKARFQKLVNEIFFCLDEEEIKFIYNFMERKLLGHQFTQNLSQQTYSQELIA